MKVKETHFFCMGVSHWETPLPVLGQLALKAQQEELLQRLAPHATELLWVSTCNRSELYGFSPDPAGALERLREELNRQLGPESLEALYQYQGQDALNYLFQVVSGMDSLVLGDAQVQEQVKKALARSKELGTAGEELTRVLSAALQCDELLRGKKALDGSGSVASVLLSLADASLGGLAGKTVLVAGAGQMAKLAALHLRQEGAGHLRVCNRTPRHATRLAKKMGGTAHPFEKLHALLESADVVVCCTSSPQPLFSRETVEAAVRARQGRRLVMVDLSAKPTIHPDVEGLEQVDIWTMEDIQPDRAGRQEATRHARALVAQAVERFLRERRPHFRGSFFDSSGFTAGPLSTSPVGL
jgi:glutamyl-tRNA reductase